MIRSFLPGMMKRNSGHIVAISSISSLSGEAKLSAYSASKWGINGKPNATHYDKTFYCKHQTLRSTLFIFLMT